MTSEIRKVVVTGDAKAFPPRIEAIGCDVRMHIDWQIVTHEFERRVQEDGDVRIGFSKGVLENDHTVDRG